ncbi:dopamine beta-hydroxylase [Corythoichthys intestinalis]|uniref:dopamine beta-hydroxylase n=1 Tax=Corythoichthys intestinalis TaxID=161448 RepID=UPI0025A4FC57|nr:dopamine beta-hydroxylase [Corythoichthys intestinalis]XP_061800658.1 dopamine beta-hydroxylase-like [Nerophis lumbriciformis]
MKIMSKDFRLQDVTVMYFTALAALMVILVASYQAPSHVTVVEASRPDSAPAPLALPMPFRVLLDPLGHLQLAWNISYARQEVYMELKVTELKHGVVFGMSDRGELTHADLVLLWNSGSQSYFGDAWSDGEGKVTLDSQQDYELIEAKRKAGGFYLLFKRPFSTCDPRDYLIEEGTVHVIYGILDQPLDSPEQLNLSRIDMGLQRILMLRPDTPAPTLPPDVQTLDVVAPDVIIPNQETTYWCSIHTLPENMAENHIVMYESVITTGNEAIVHHIEVFECSPDDGDVPQYSGSCENKMVPAKLNFCRHVLAAWAMGAEAFYYPPDAGLPIGGPGSSRFLRLEVHYHNPLLISGRRDSSGIRLHYTPSLRRYDAGIMELGLVYTPIMAVPPKQHNFYLTGYCTSKCTRTALPRGGIFIFASQLHTHLAGRGVRTVLVRGGKEIEIVQEDQHFSTHYQTIRVLRKMANVLPGDVLITKCTYNTEDREKPTVGGFGIMEEMCVNYVHYYPRTQLELCKSHVDLDHLQKYFSFINRFQGKDQCVCGNDDVTEQYSGLQWDGFATQVLDSLYNTAPISMHCNQSTARLFPGEWNKQTLPVVTSPLKKSPYPCKVRARATSSPDLPDRLSQFGLL